MQILNKIKNAGKALRDKWAEAQRNKKTEKALREAAREISEAHPKGPKEPGLIDVASVYRKGRNRRRDIRKTQRRFRSNGASLALVNRPGNIVDHKGLRCIVTNKGRFIPFKTVEE